MNLLSNFELLVVTCEESMLSSGSYRLFLDIIVKS